MAVQVGIWSRDQLSVSALKKGSVTNGDTEFSFVDPTQLKQHPSFQPDRFSSKLSTRQIGQTLLASAALPSTQTLLHQNFTRFPDGAICVADVQTSGKGRGSNTWTSPIGCLMFSIYRKLCISGERLPFVQYVVSLAIVGAVQEVCRPLIGDSKLDVRIKWPNDIYANKLKIGGILCQSVYRDGIFHLIIGSGLNVNNAQPTTCLASMISQLTGKDVAAAGGISREDILAEIANRLEEMLGLLAEKGFAPLKETYLQSWLHSGQDVTLEEEKDGQIQKVALQITGISDNGYLTAVDSHGEVFELHPDGNSLDFFAGLVRHKKTS